MNPGSPAASLAARNLRFLLALAPALCAQAVLADGGLPLRLAVAMPLALAFEALCLRLRGLSLRDYLAEGEALRIAVLLAMWLPGIAPAPGLAALFTALALRQAFGGLGAQPFNAVMAGAALAQLLQAPPLPAGSDGHWLSLAVLAGGLALLAMRLVRWQLPVALLAGATLAALSAGESLVVLRSAPWLLAAFFILPECASRGESARTQGLAGAAIGAGAVLAAGGAGATALPFAVLAYNALVPALDARFLARPRSAA